MSNSKLNPPPDLDSDQLMRLLELELAHKRGEWKRSHQRARNARINALAFLFFLICAGGVALMYLFSSVNEQRSMRPQAPPPAADATP